MSSDQNQNTTQNIGASEVRPPKGAYDIDAATDPGGMVKVLDLTDEPPSPETAQVYLRPFDPAESREWVRKWAALILIGTILAVVIGSFVILGIQAASDDGLLSEDFKDVISLLFTPIIGVVGTVLGFYFGSKDRF